MRTRLARSIGIVALVAGMIGLSTPNVAGASPAAPASAPPVPAVAGVPSSPAVGVSPATSAGWNWVDGVVNENATFLYGNPISGYLIGYDSADVGYYPYTDASGYPTGDFPQVGDVYDMHVVVAVVGNPGSGGDMPNIQVQLPDNTQLAISASNPTYCYFYGATNYQVTCPTPGTGTVLPIWLGTVPIASYYMFEEQFPVVTTAALDGISNPESYLANYNDWAIGEFDSGAQEYDWEPIWVPPVAVNTTITAKPASSTTSTSASFSFTSSLGGSSFKCRLDSGSWAACVSPKAYSGLTLGSHTFSVAAVDSFGHVDPTPASYTWSITGTAGPATHLSVSGVLNPFPAGSKHSVTVTALDAKGNVAVGYRGTIHFTSSDTHAALPADYTFTAADKGVHKFPNTLSPGLTLKTAGSQWVRATDKTTASITGSQTVTVTPAKATHFSVGTYNPYPASSAHSVTVTARDLYGNVATGYRGTIHFTSSDTKATLPADYTFTSADKGAHTFSYTLNPKLVLKTAGSQWVRATDKTTASITGSQTVTVTPGAATHLTVGTYNPYPAGVTHSVTVKALDAYGNVATGYLGTIHFTSSDKKAILPADYTFTAADKGVHTFTSALVLKTAGSQWVRATDKTTASITGAQTVTVTS